MALITYMSWMFWFMNCLKYENKLYYKKTKTSGKRKTNKNNKNSKAFLTMMRKFEIQCELLAHVCRLFQTPGRSNRGRRSSGGPHNSRVCSANGPVQRLDVEVLPPYFNPDFKDRPVVVAVWCLFRVSAGFPPQQNTWSLTKTCPRFIMSAVTGSRLISTWSTRTSFHTSKSTNQR